MSTQQSSVTPQQSSQLTRQLATFLKDLRFESLPHAAVELSKHCLLDWLGVTLAGAREPAAAIVRREAELQSGVGPCRVIGTRVQLGPFWAALANGTASHALDFDDVVAAMAGHPTVPIVPALLALAESEPPAATPGVTNAGRRFISAFVAGFEAECRIGTLVAPSHYSRGFHVTSTVGTFGAAAACAHWLALDLPRWQHAFGLAGTQAAGLKCMFGTMTKPFHAGRAAASGLLAARLAANGFTAHECVLDVEQGFVATQSDAANPAALRDLGARFGIEGVLFKYHAACYLTHAGIEALLELRGEHALTPEQIAAVRLYVAPGHLNVCNIQQPCSGLEAKFSLRFTAAMVLAGKHTDQRDFTTEVVHDPLLSALAERVSVVPVTTLANNYQSEVEVVLNDGRVLRRLGDVSRPAAAELDRQWSRLTAKFATLAEPLLGTAGAACVVERVARLESLASMDELTALTEVRA
jgi:2-methylcitrate dehydratase PrpD